MQIQVLDPKRTHETPEGVTDCPMRLSPTPDHRRWVCLDCGLEILWTRLDVELAPHCRCTGDGPGGKHDFGCPFQESVLKTEEELQTYKISEAHRKKIVAEADIADLSMGCHVEKEMCKVCDPHIDRITVRCKHSGQVLNACAYPNGFIRWSCPCGHYYEKSVHELPTLSDDIVIDEDCRRKDWP